MKRTVAWIGILGAALAGAALVWWATGYGPGIAGDATIYLTSARNFAQGKGMGWTEVDGSFRLLPYFPPGYPLVLSLLAWLRLDLATGARLLNALLLAGSAALTGWATLHAADGEGQLTWSGAVWAALAAALVGVSPAVLSVHTWAMSEGLYIFAATASLALLALYLDSSRRGGWLALAGLLAGLAFLTRYIGAAALAAGVAALLALQPGQLFRRRVADALLFTLLSGLPMLIWLAVDWSLTGTVASRSGLPLGQMAAKLAEMVEPLSSIVLFWVAPDSVAARVQGTALLAVGAAAALALLAAAACTLRWLLASRAGSRAARLAVLAGLYVAAYLALLTVVHVFTYPPITLASRMLAPAFAGVALWGAALLLAVPEGRVRVGVLVAAALLAGTYGIRSAAIARTNARTGIGYSSPDWQESQVIATLRKLPADTPVVTNEVTAIMYFFNRPAYALAEIYAQEPLKEFTAYGSGDDPAQLAFREDGAALALFAPFLESDFGMYGDRVHERLDALVEGLRPAYEGGDGGVYFYR